MAADKSVLERFLRKVDRTFPVPLSHKQDLAAFAEKLSEKATLCAEYDSGEIISLTAGYTENLTDSHAYISVVATLPQYQGRGLAKKLIKQFIAVCREKNIEAVHLYAVKENTAAMNMYLSMGFSEWKTENEQRPDDAHLIYYLKKGA